MIINNMGKFKEMREDLMMEARNNQISPQNIYNTETIKQFIEDQGDSYFELGDFILAKPVKQPCDYAKYTSKTYCVSNPNKKDWGMVEANGMKFHFVFRKMEDSVNRKKLKTHDVMAFAYYPNSVNFVNTLSVDQITEMMWTRAIEEIGKDFKYTKNFVRELATQVKDLGYFIEFYDRDNGVILPEDFKKILSKGGTSLSELIQSI